MPFLARLYKNLGGRTLRQVRRFFVAVIGGTVLLLGFVMIFTPGPAVVVIPAGLAILATEFAWAKRWLDKARALAAKAKRKKSEVKPVGK